MAVYGSSTTESNAQDRRVRLDTLVRLRWFAVAGQTATVLVVGSLFGFPDPLLLCFAPIGALGLLNLYFRLRYPPNFRLTNRSAMALLAFDELQLGVLLALTGGLENPFCILILVPVMVSATTLLARHTQLLGLLVLAMTALLAAYHLPLPWSPDQPPGFPTVYVIGLWVALACCLGFMSVYAFRVSEEARLLADALAATELVLTREQHLSALDGLAAAAAHALGTPLGTIVVVAKELSREIPPGTPHGDDIALLVSQSERCREVLAKLTSLSTQTDWHFARLPLTLLVAEVVEPYLEFGVGIKVVPPTGKGPEPVGRRNPAIVYGLSNLLENAVDFAHTEVSVSATWNAEDVTLTIADDGPGFAADIIDRLGEPYLTTRPTHAREPGSEEGGGGLGLGFFIAKTLLERNGGRLTLFNQQPPHTGAVVRIRWPRRAMDLTEETTAGTIDPTRQAITWRQPAESV